MSKFRIKLSESFPIITLTKNIYSISTHHTLTCPFQEDFFLWKNLSTNPLIPCILHITHFFFFTCLESSITWSAPKILPKIFIHPFEECFRSEIQQLVSGWGENRKWFDLFYSYYYLCTLHHLNQKLPICISQAKI